MNKKITLALVLFPLFLAGCGGGSSSSSTSSTISTASSTSASYPEGVSGASPTSVATTSGTTTASLPIQRRIKDWGIALAESIRMGDVEMFKKVAFAAMPTGNAWAAPAKVPEGAAFNEFLSRVTAGTVIPNSQNLDLNAFFVNYSKANCYGPQVLYSGHPDGADQTPPNLPGGDVGMWLAREDNQTTGVPCSAAQFRALMQPVKKRINSTLIFGARMRALAGTALPTTGNTLDLTADVNTFYQTLLPTGITGAVTSASITNNAGSYTYTVIATGSGSGGGITVTKKILVKVVHNGASANFNGVASYATYSSHTNNPVGVNSCDPLGGTAGAGKKIDVGTVRYSKGSATEMNVSAREATYCLNGNESNLTSTLSDYVALTSDGELDQTKTACINSCIGANSKGWISTIGATGFKRFGSTYNPVTHEGNYKFAWQAGIGDSHSRMFAMNMSYNSTTEVRTGQAFFGFSGAMNPQTSDSTNSDLKGMICNWAGPSATIGSHTPNNYFQYQRITLGANSGDWDISTASDSNKISFAPTNNCAGRSNFYFDVDANGALSPSTEGANAINGLDTLDSGKTSVQATIEGRGFTNPTLY